MLAIQYGLYDIVKYLVEEAAAPLDAITNVRRQLSVHPHDLSWWSEVLPLVEFTQTQHALMSATCLRVPWMTSA